MKITLYWSEYSNRIFYVKNKVVYTIDGITIDIPCEFMINCRKNFYHVHKIGEI